LAGASGFARLDRQVRLPPLPAAISSMVRPESTDVAASATRSRSGSAVASSCFISSHCGFSPPRVLTSSHDPRSRSPWKVTLILPRRCPASSARSASSPGAAPSTV
jgi:hypothetical protein